MKTVRMHGYEASTNFGTKMYPTAKPSPDEVLVKVFATSVNPIDWKIRRGDLKDVMPLHFPVILGRDVEGEVVETGTNVTALKPGQRVTGFSTSRNRLQILRGRAGRLRAK